MPAELAGESALGAWWAARVGGLIGVAAAVFLGIWLNLTSELPAWLRLAQVVLIGAGALMSFRAGWSVLLGEPGANRVKSSYAESWKDIDYTRWDLEGRLDKQPAAGDHLLDCHRHAVGLEALSWHGRGARPEDLPAAAAHAGFVVLFAVLNHAVQIGRAHV